MSGGFRPAVHTWAGVRRTGSTAGPTNREGTLATHSQRAGGHRRDDTGRGAPAAAVNTVTTANGANWQIHDAAPPILDTGSIRAISDNAFYGFGGIRVKVSDIPASDPTGRLNGELMRGFGLAYDGDETFATTTPVPLGGVAISRTIKVVQAGQLDALAGHVRATRRAARSRWTCPSAARRARTRPTTRARSRPPRPGTRRSTPRTLGRDQLAQRERDEHARSVRASSSAPPGRARTSSATLRRAAAAPPGSSPTSTATATRSRSLRARRSRCCSTSSRAGRRRRRRSARRAAVVSDERDGPGDHADLAGLVRRRAVHRRRTSRSPARTARTRRCRAAGVPPVEAPKTTALRLRRGRQVDHADRADMESGLTTSQAITRAYLDRIEAYDKGPFGFHAFITVAEDAMAQAAAADAKRAAGIKGDLLGMPVDREGPLRHQGHADHGRQPRVRGLAAQARRVPGREAARRRRDHPRQGQHVASSPTPAPTASPATAWCGTRSSRRRRRSARRGGSAVAIAASLAGFGMGSPDWRLALRAEHRRVAWSRCAARTASPPARA